MNNTELEKLIVCFEGSSLTELKYSNGGTKVQLARKQGEPATARQPSLVPAQAHQVSAAAPQTTGQLVLAPMTGIVYLKPSPSEASFTAVGGNVSEGDTIAVIEAMKLFNPLEAEFSCEILEILVSDGQDVERGAPIYRVRKVTNV